MTAPAQTEPTVVEVTESDREIAHRLWVGMPERTALWELVAVAVATGREMGRLAALAHLAEAKRAHVPQRQAALRGENVADDADVAADAAFEAAELAKRGDEPW